MFWVVSAVAGLLLALIATILTTQRPGPRPVDPNTPLMNPAAYSSMEIVPFSMVDQNGNPIDNSALRGNWTVMSFMFTHCVLACPTLQGNMYRLAESQTLRDEPVRFMSVSMDPENDTVERLNRYASDMGVDYDRWKLVRGEADLIHGFMTSLGFVPPSEDGNPNNLITLPDGSTMGNIIHPNSFLVINPEGQVVGRYRGDDPKEIEQLAIDLKRAING
jgi:protein SCO1/2